MRLLGLARSSLVCAALAVTALTGCSRSPASRIEKVLNQSAEVSKKAGALSADPARQAAAVADGFQAIDASGCPPDFRVAFQQHINCWRQAQSAFAGNTLGNNIAEGFVAGLTENYSGLGASQNAAAVANQQINDSYYQLTAIAAAHGARVPRSVVE